MIQRVLHLAAMTAAIKTDENESDTKAKATGAVAVADKPGQPEDKDLPRDAKAKSVLNAATKPTCRTMGSTPEIRVDQNRVCRSTTTQSDAQYEQCTNHALRPVGRSRQVCSMCTNYAAVKHTCPTTRLAPPTEKDIKKLITRLECNTARPPYFCRQQCIDRAPNGSGPASRTLSNAAAKPCSTTGSA